VIRASRAELDIREFPIALHTRGGESKLSPLRDGWRHLRLILLYNPDFLFLVPGFLTALVGAAVMALVFAHATLFGHIFFIHTLIGGSLLVIVLGDVDPWLQRMTHRFRLEHGLLLGTAVRSAAWRWEAS
jgi:hypothetical protein